MDQTDRQTDKASHWKSAIFDLDDNWAKLDAMPPFIKRLHRQKEICPTTQKPHFQIHVECSRQVRFTQLTQWIKATKWIPVFGAQHIANSIAYCAKSKSAVEGTHSVIEGEQYLQIHDLLRVVARYAQGADPVVFNHLDKDCWSWQRVTSMLVSQDLKWVNKLCNPVLEKCWKLWGHTFIYKFEDECAEGSFIIEDPGVGDFVAPEECLISDEGV